MSKPTPLARNRTRLSGVAVVPTAEGYVSCSRLPVNSSALPTVLQQMVTTRVAVPTRPRRFDLDVPRGPRCARADHIAGQRGQLIARRARPRPIWTAQEVVDPRTPLAPPDPLQVVAVLLAELVGRVIEQSLADPSIAPAEPAVRASRL